MKNKKIIYPEFCPNADNSTHADGRVSCADLLSGEIYQSD